MQARSGKQISEQQSESRQAPVCINDHVDNLSCPGSHINSSKSSLSRVEVEEEDKKEIHFFADENVPVHQHHSLDLDMQRKLADYNPSIKPACLSSSVEQASSHTPSFLQSGQITSMLSPVHIQSSSAAAATAAPPSSQHQHEQQSQLIDDVDLKKSNEFFLERLHYHLVSKYNDRLTSEQIQAMIALLKMISQSKRQIKKISSQSDALEEGEEEEVILIYVL
ncbi:unnamed protein product [Trichobilharzia regenti]|nr:unnamed protein product [Trichobilharzia regenti]